MKNGIPYDLAYMMSDERRTAIAIVFSEMEGSKFNWDTMEFYSEES